MQRNDIKIIYKHVKNASLKVKPNLEVLLTVPVDMTNKEIDYILKKREDWINKHLEFFSDNQVVEKKLISGEDFVYLGKHYRLKVIESNNERVKLNHSYFEVYVENKGDYDKKTKLIDEWYKEKAKKHFQKAIDKYQSIVNIDINRIRIRKMKTRWGSCNPSKSYINLNLELIKKPKVAIEYVIFHELTHLIHHNHGKNFYNYLSLHMPDWKKRKEKLY